MQGNYVFAAARSYLVLIPSLFLAAPVLAVNLVGHGLPDALDPRAALEP